eukprot:tig00000449_g959.t1
MPSEGQTDAQIAAWWERKYEEAVELWGECERRATALHEENKRLQEAVEKLQGDERASNRALKKKLDASEVLFQRLLENVEDERRQNQELRECAKASERRKREVEGAFQQILEEAEALRHSNNELAMSSAEVLKVNEVLHERVRLLEGHVQLLQEQLEQLRGENAELKTEARSSAAAAAAAAAAASASAYQCDCRYSAAAARAVSARPAAGTRSWRRWRIRRGGEGPEEAEDIDALAIAGDVRRALRQGTRDASQAAAPARRAPTRPLSTYPPQSLGVPLRRGGGGGAPASRPPPSRRRAPPPPPPPLRPEPRHVGQQLARLRRGSFPFRFAPSFFVLPGLSGSIEREVHANMHLGSVGAPGPPRHPPAPVPAPRPAEPPPRQLSRRPAAPTGPGARAAWSEPSPTPAPSPTSPHLPRTPSSERRTPQGRLAGVSASTSSGAASFAFGGPLSPVLDPRLTSPAGAC